MASCFGAVLGVAPGAILVTVLGTIPAAAPQIPRAFSDGFQSDAATHEGDRGANLAHVSVERPPNGHPGNVQARTNRLLHIRGIRKRRYPKTLLYFGYLGRGGRSGPSIPIMKEKFAFLFVYTENHPSALFFFYNGPVVRPPNGHSGNIKSK